MQNLLQCGTHALISVVYFVPVSTVCVVLLLRRVKTCLIPCFDLGAFFDPILTFQKHA